MHVRGILATATAVLLTLVILLRHNLRDLAEVGRTYATFYPYLNSHPEVLLRYPEQADHYRTERSARVPQIIHQVFLTEGQDTGLEKYDEAITSCQDLHQNWTHHLWTDESANAFMAEHQPRLWQHYSGYRQSIQRANILRYALLEHFGGVYLDLDVTCLKPLDDLRQVSFLTPGAYPAGVNNAFILAKPGHAFLKHLLEGVESRDLTWGLPYIENMLSTGCMYFSNRWMSYLRTSPSAGTNETDMVRVLADQNGNMDPHMLRGVITTPLFHHGGASSWHGWDAAAIVLIGKHYIYFLLLLSMIVACTAIFISRTVAHRRFRRSRSPVRRSMEKRYSDEERSPGLKLG